MAHKICIHVLFFLNSCPFSYFSGVKPAGQDWNDPDIQNYLKILETKQPLLIIHEEIDDAFLVSIVIVLGDIKINVADDLVSIGLAVPISEVIAFQC